MEGDRKYKQRGYQDSGSREQNGGQRGDRPRGQGPRAPLDVTGPRLPRMVQAVAASRCFNCATMLPPDTDFSSTCPKCGTDLHCCKQCTYFEPSTRFQCRKPLKVRISPKDKANECELFKARVTVARDSVQPQTTQSVVTRNIPSPRNVDDARAAFDSLFKNSD